MELIRQWLLGVAGTAFLTALAQGLMPEGTVKKVGRLIGGLLLFLAMFRPVLSFDFSGLALQLEQADWTAADGSQALLQENQSWMEEVIAEQTAAYIEEKAAGLRADCTAEVLCRQSETDLPVPYAAHIEGELSPQAREALEVLIAQELDIPSERQSYGQEEQP